MLGAVPVMADTTDQGIDFRRGLDANGSSWDAVSAVGSGIYQAQALSVEVGNPLIGAVVDHNVNNYGQRRSLFILASADSNGDAWNDPVFLDSARADSRIAMTALSSGAGFAWVSDRTIFYDRADL